MGDYTPVLAMDDDKVFALIVVGGAFTIALVGIIAGVAKSMLSARMRETTRREIAAYIAEGSMTQEEGERLLTAGPKDRSGCC